MCYFDDVPLIRDEVIPREQAIKAWKAFCCHKRGVYISPVRLTPASNEIVWKVNKPKRATAHGFYALSTRGEAERQREDCVCRVLLWGRVREHKGYGRRGYRAQYCMILPTKKRTAKRRET